jgi:N4-gp56 family major capsid protein
MPQIYNDPVNAADSSIGSQFRTDNYLKVPLIEARKLQYFMPLSGTVSMPKNMGKTMKKFHYLPLLDDANINDEGIDAAGATILTSGYDVNVPSLINAPRHVEAAEASFTKAHAEDDVIFITDSSQWVVLTADTVVGYDASTAGGADGTEIADAAVKAYLEADTTGIVAAVVDNQITLTGTRMQFTTLAAANTAAAVVRGAVVSQNSGNLYGSSKDVGTISGKLPVLGETGGRVNRVGFKRINIEGSMEKFGFFDEWTKESLDFDTDAELATHINREMINGAVEMTEDALQIDLLNSAGVVRYAGVATSKATIGATSLVDYDDLLRLSITLDNNRTPKQTKVITGTRMIDTKTIAGGRVLYCGSEMLPTLEAMEDLHGNQAFVAVQHYAAGGDVLNGEEGTIGKFRIVVVPEMQKFAGAGADATGSATNYETGDAFDVFPMLCVGDGSFTTIGFQTDGKTVKFRIIAKKPGVETADRNEPFGEVGFMSIAWWYGFLLERSERIGVIYTSATL